MFLNSRYTDVVKLPGEYKKFQHLASFEQIKSMRPKFKTEVFIDQSKANFVEKILCDKIAHLLDQDLRKCW